MKQKKNAILLISWILTAIHLIYLVYLQIGIVEVIKSAQSGAEAAIPGIFIELSIPIALIVLIGFIFNIIAWKSSGKGFVLIAGIIYAISGAIGVLFPCFIFELIPMALTFIGYSQLRKIKKEESA